MQRTDTPLAEATHPAAVSEANQAPHAESGAAQPLAEASPPNWAQGQITAPLPHAEALQLIEQAQTLPAAVRERLVTAISATADAKEPTVPLAAVIAAVEQSLPDYLRSNAPATPATHPHGEAFFRGAAGELTDSEAEALAQQQLQRAGLLRGQRVRASE